MDTHTGQVVNELVCKSIERVPTGFPEFVRLFGERWNIVYVKGLYDARAKTKRGKRLKLYGMCLGTPRLIVIETECPRYEMIDTLYHEMGHVYVRRLMPHDCKLFKYEETIVDLFAKGFADAAANNRLPSESC